MQLLPELAVSAIVLFFVIGIAAQNDVKLHGTQG